VSGHQQESTVETPARTQHMVAQVIAGPETAARLGVPVGSIVEARHVITDLDSGEQLTPPDGGVISVEESIQLVGHPNSESED
jgi:hypothetical protein